MRKRVFLLLAILFFFLEIWFASQVHMPLSPKVVESNEAFSLKVTDNFKLYNMNILEPSFHIADQLLTISSKRGNDLAWSIFETSVKVNVPLRRDLTLKYAISTPQLNLATDAVRFRFFIVNGTNVVVLAYQIGYTEQDRVPDPDAKSYSYVFYQIGNNTNTWFEGERKIWNDLINRDVLLENSWRVELITFGVMSYQKDPDIENQRMEGVLKLDDTSLYYENMLTAEMTSYDSQVSQYALAGMIMSLVLFFGCSGIVIKTRGSKNLRSTRQVSSNLRSLVHLQLVQQKNFFKKMIKPPVTVLCYPKRHRKFNDLQRVCLTWKKIA